MSEVQYTPEEQAQIAAATAANPMMGAVTTAAVTQRAVVRTAINTEAGAKAASFSVDIEQIPGLIAKYEEAREELSHITQHAQELRSIGEKGAPGNDEVSKSLAASLGKMASDEPYKLSWAVKQGVDRLSNQIDQLRKALSEYQSADEAATPTQS